MNQIPLHEALICINCNTITRMPCRYCPHCAGAHLVAVSGWLSPRPERIRQLRVCADPRSFETRPGVVEVSHADR